MNRNPYIPHTATVEEIWSETGGARCIKTLRVVFDEREVREGWTHRPGQCAMIGIPGVGESMISISSSPTEPEYLRFSVMKAGKVTGALHQLEPGDKMTIRGPYGNGFPVDDWKGKNILTVGGGIGQAPLRSVVEYVKAHPQEYGKLILIYGARCSEDLCFKPEFREMASTGKARCYLTIDQAEEGWEHYVGFVPSLLMEVSPSPGNTIAITCGPPVMIRSVLENLQELGFADDQIYTTLENRMKCGIGKCGRCNAGPLYVCQDGPVFSYNRLKNIPEAFA